MSAPAAKPRSTGLLLHDLLVLLAVGVFVLAYVLLDRWRFVGDDAHDLADLLLSATGLAAFAMLILLLCVGPLARVSHVAARLIRFRRHFGVLTFLVAAVHAAIVMQVNHNGFGWAAWKDMLTSRLDEITLTRVPYEQAGFLGLVGLGVLALTSTDGWVRRLSTRRWKALHMSLYAVYALVVLHVAFGTMVKAEGWWYPVLLCGSTAVVCGLHVAMGIRQVRRDRQNSN